jgi:hypothetical protein
MPAGPAERLREALAIATAQGAGPDDAGTAGLRTIAVGWATVDLDRAARELAADLGIDPRAFVAAPGSAALGATVRVAPAVLPDGIAIAILEPSIDRRLAGILARHDEGPVAVWLVAAGDGVAGAGAAAAEAEAPAAEAEAGPFGPERRLAGERPDRFLVERPAGTIAS